MLKWISRTFSIATAISIALLIGAWPLRADLLDGAMVVARNVLPPNVQTGNYALSQLDAFVSSVSMVGGHTLTVPPATNFLNGSLFTICNSSPNDNSHHAVLQPAAPNPAFGRLYMTQCEQFTSANGVWKVSAFQGRFRPAFTPTFFIDNGGVDTNDGLVSNAAANAIASVTQCFTLIQNEYDLSNTGHPTCGPTSGQMFTAAALTYSHGGTGDGVVYVIGQGGAANFRTSGNVVLEEYDFGGYLIFANIQLDCTGAGSHPCYGLFIHQQGGADISSAAPATAAVTFVGNDATDVAIWCDSQCKVNSATAPIISGSFGTVFQIDQGGILDLNAGLTQNATVASNVFLLTHGSTLQWSGTLTFGGGNTANQFLYASNLSQAVFNTLTISGSIGGGARAYQVINSAILCNASATAIPGTAGTTSGGSFAGQAAASGGTCSP